MTSCCCTDGNTDHFEIKTVSSHTASKAKDLPVDESERTFEIVVTKTEAQPAVGLDVARKNGINLRIQGIKPGGLIEAWNKQQPTAATRVKENDTIEAVNGTEGSVQAILQAISQAQELRMKILTHS